MSLEWPPDHWQVGPLGHYWPPPTRSFLSSWPLLLLDSAGTLERTKASTTLNSSPSRSRALMLFVDLTSENSTFLFIHVTLHDRLLKNLSCVFFFFFHVSSCRNFQHSGSSLSFVTHTSNSIPVANPYTFRCERKRGLTFTTYRFFQQYTTSDSTEMQQYKNQQSLCKMALSPVVD